MADKAASVLTKLKNKAKESGRLPALFTIILPGRIFKTT